MVPIVAVRTLLEPGEGIEDFIDAAVLVSWAEPDTCFLILEDGRPSRNADLHNLLYRQRVLDRIRRVGMHDKLRIIDAPSNAPRVLAQCTIAVVPSPSGFHVRECRDWMAAGVPVVVARTDHASEDVADGETGLLVPPNDPQELATEIVRLLRAPDLAARVADAARRLVGGSTNRSGPGYG